jgi:hypothetical protein
MSRLTKTDSPQAPRSLDEAATAGVALVAGSAHLCRAPATGLCHRFHEPWRRA